MFSGLAPITLTITMFVLSFGGLAVLMAAMCVWDMLFIRKGDQ